MVENGGEMTVTSIIRDWLLLVGDQYGIREAHQDRRVADQAKPVAPYFVYRFTDSQTDPGVAGDLTTASGASDANIKYYKMFTRTLEIECHTPMRPTVAGDIDGMRVLEAVQVSIHHPAADEILTSEPDNAVSLRDALTVTNDTEVEEQSIYRMYTLQMTVDINTYFSLLRTNHRVDDYTLTGTLHADTGEDITVTVTDTTT